MKIVVLTRRYGYNFGSSLQAYAMRLMLERLGHEVTVLNYDEFAQHPAWKIKPLLRSIFIPVLYLLNRTGLKSKMISNAIIEYNQKKQFKKFDADFIKPTRNIISSTNDFFKEIIGKDICICGSDQIWNPSFYDSHYFLDFCDKTKIKKVAYAPSFGVSHINKYRQDIKNLLRDFDLISIREKQGQTILQDLINKSCPVVLDPTLMIDSSIWREKKSRVSIKLPKRFIACYFLGHKYIPIEQIQTLARKLNCEIVNITTFRTRNNIKGIQLNQLSPIEFIDVIDRAFYVLTDSFHATVFSIIFKCNFYSFSKHKHSDINNENSRILSLLELFGLNSRYIDDNSDISIKEINFSDIDKRMDVLRNQSYDFLFQLN